MDSLQAFAMGEAHRHERQRVFDWDRAARLIVEHKPRLVEAGLRDDWEWTGGTIYEDGCPVRDSYTYLASTWAIPEIALDGEVEACWCWLDESPGWDADTKWPASAINILQETD